MSPDQDAIIRQHSGVSTVWLISTLGSKSTTYKKVSKKDIQSVSIPQTCDVIKNPPQPMALRLTSNLLYGVALVYKQKTDYLNNDTVLIKTRIQREQLYGGKSAERHLLLPGTTIQNMKGSGSRASDGRGQVLLADDPLFNIQFSLLPPLADLDFLEQYATAQGSNDLAKKRAMKQGIRDADLKNNVLTFGNPASSSQLGDDKYESMVLHQPQVDELDVFNGNNDPEFAFDADGLLLDLDLGMDDPAHVNFQKHQPPQGDEFEMDFGYDDDQLPHPLPLPVLTADLEGVYDDPLGDMDHIIELRPEFPHVEDTPILPPTSTSAKKKRNIKTHSTTNIIVDDPISLFTDELRRARDDYVLNMQRPPPSKKQKLDSQLVDMRLALAEDSYLPSFTTPLSMLAPPIETARGRPRHRDNDEDFVDRLMRDRGSSYSLEVRRDVSRDSRRHSRSSISSIPLPLEGGEDQQGEHLHFDDPLGDGFYDLDFGDDAIGQGVDDTDAASSRKRSSSSIRRFQTVQEDHVVDFDFDFGGDDPYRINSEPVIRSSRSGSLGPMLSSQRDALNPEEINTKYGKQTLKFLKYIETRCYEEDSNTLTFETLVDQGSRRSIIAKAFYEVLQLTTLNQIGVEVTQPRNHRFKIMRANEFQVTL